MPVAEGATVLAPAGDAVGAGKVVADEPAGGLTADGFTVAGAAVGVREATGEELAEEPESTVAVAEGTIGVDGVRRLFDTPSPLGGNTLPFGDCPTDFTDEP